MTRPARAVGFEEAVAEHRAALVRRLTVVIGGDVEAAGDLAQETFLRAYRSWDRFDGTDVRAWLYTIGLRLAFNERDRRQRWRDLLSRQRPEAPTWVRPDHTALHQALAALPQRQRAALFLSAVDGYSQAEIAAILDAPPGTVASWLSRSKAHLREVLRDD